MVGVNTLLKDRYRLGEKIATGGMGTVFRATDEKLGRTVAIKLLAENLAGDASFVERFRREARASAGLRHPNIANVFDAGDEDECHFIVMELAEGRDLARVLREEGPLAPERAVKIVDQIGLALGHAHAAGIIHRDVKPANVIVGPADSVKVTDFGIARAADDSKLTQTGSILGTAHYISPEQAEGKPMSPRSDIYSLGIVMYETLTGALPFTGDSLMAVAMRHINDDVPAPSAINASVPPELDDIVARATSKDPNDRYRETSEMHEALNAALVPTNTSTAVLPAMAATEPQGTVWPIPGQRWDPESLGRKVLLVFGFLGLIAMVLLFWRLSTNDTTPAAAERDHAPRSESAGSQPSPANSALATGVIGMNFEQVQAELLEAGYDIEVEYVQEGGEEGVVVGTDPSPGTTLEDGQTITLFVSDGGDEDDEDSDEEGSDPKGNAKGHDKKEDD